MQAQGLAQVLFPMTHVFPVSCRENMGYKGVFAGGAVCYWDQNIGPGGEDRDLSGLCQAAWKCL